MAVICHSRITPTNSRSMRLNSWPVAGTNNVALPNSYFWRGGSVGGGLAFTTSPANGVLERPARRRSVRRGVSVAGWPCAAPRMDVAWAGGGDRGSARLPDCAYGGQSPHTTKTPEGLRNPDAPLRVAVLSNRFRAAALGCAGRPRGAVYTAPALGSDPLRDPFPLQSSLFARVALSLGIGPNER